MKHILNKVVHPDKFGLREETNLLRVIAFWRVVIIWETNRPARSFKLREDIAES